MSSFAGTDYNDIHGGVWSPSVRDSRESRSVRRGLYRVTAGGSTATGQAKLAQVATALNTAHGPFHPTITSLPLRKIAVSRIGADLYEYQLDYDRQTSSTSTIRISLGAQGRAAVPYADEADSGRRWTPNRPPGFYIAPTFTWNIVKTRRFNSINDVNTVLSTSVSGSPSLNFNWVTSVQTVNDDSYTLAAGLDFGAGALLYTGTDIVQAEDGIVTAIVKFEYLSISAPTYTNAPTLVSAGHGVGSYTAISGRPYWAPQWDNPIQKRFPAF